MLRTIYGADERYREEYLSRHVGYYLTGDSGYIDEDGHEVHRDELALLRTDAHPNGRS